MPFSVRSNLFATVAIGALLIGQATVALANPEGGVVVGGNASIEATDARTVTIKQSSQRAILNWQKFGNKRSEQIIFDQPSVSSATLNRDLSGTISRIDGAIKAPGSVFVVNPAGVIIGRESRIDTGSFVATTSNITDDNFMNGRYEFNQPGLPGATVINHGTITATEAGIAALVAPQARNSGVIVARKTAAVAGTNTFTLDLYGDDQLKVGVDDPNAVPHYDLNGNPITHSAVNTGTMRSDGGFVLLTATDAAGAIRSLVKTEGELRADTKGYQAGEVQIGGANTDTALITGTVSATGAESGETGGRVIVTAKDIGLSETAAIDVSGHSGGGRALVGGDYMGGNPDPQVVALHNIPLETSPIPTAKRVIMNAGATINADATEVGDGGKVILWGDEFASFFGNITARGGQLSGDGGFVETSALNLQAFGLADASAVNGEAGTWLLDPLNITIVEGFGSSADVDLGNNEIRPAIRNAEVGANLINVSLGLGNNVTVTTKGTSGSQDGDIIVASDILKVGGGDATLSLVAAGDILFEGVGTATNDIDIVSTSGRLSLIALADGDIVANNPSPFPNSPGFGFGGFNLNGGSFVFSGDDLELVFDQGFNTDGGGGAFRARDDIDISVPFGISTNGGDIVLESGDNLTYNSSGAFDLDGGDLEISSGGTVSFDAGEFDLGSGEIDLQFEGDVRFDVQGPMPDVFVRRTSGSERIEVDLSFERGDDIRFFYDDETLEVPSGGIVYGNGNVTTGAEIFGDGLFLVLNDRSLLDRPDRKLLFRNLQGSGANEDDALNGIPEAINDPNRDFVERAEPPSGVVPVIEISFDEGLTVERLAPTSPQGIQIREDFLDPPDDPVDNTPDDPDDAPVVENPPDEPVVEVPVDDAPIADNPQPDDDSIDDQQVNGGSIIGGDSGSSSGSASDVPFSTVSLNNEAILLNPDLFGPTGGVTTPTIGNIEVLELQPPADPPAPKTLADFEGQVISQAPDFFGTLNRTLDEQQDAIAELAYAEDTSTGGQILLLTVYVGGDVLQSFVIPESDETAIRDTAINAIPVGKIIDRTGDAVGAIRTAARGTDQTTTTFRTLDELVPNGRIPSGPEFNEWFDELSVDEFQRVVSDPVYKKRVASLTRDEGLHEWLPINQLAKVKEWGVSMAELKEFRSATTEVIGTNPFNGRSFQHSVIQIRPDGTRRIVPGAGQGSFHNELSAAVQESSSLDEFNQRLENLIIRWDIDPRIFQDRQLPTIRW